MAWLSRRREARRIRRAIRKGRVEVSQLTNLETLDLRGNLLVALPAELGQLTNLKKLDLGANRLTALPTELGQLTNLQELDLGGNRLTALPTELGQLTNLQRLDVQYNYMTALPTELGQLTNLQKLDLGKNRLTSLPSELGQLTNLQELNLRKNRLTSLPVELGQLTNLKELNLRANPLEAPLQEFVEQGVLAMLAYLRSLADAAPRYEGKLVSVDATRVGKSQDRQGTDSQRKTRPWSEKSRLARKTRPWSEMSRLARIRFILGYRIFDALDWLGLLILIILFTPLLIPVGLIVSAFLDGSPLLAFETWGNILYIMAAVAGLIAGLFAIVKSIQYGYRAVVWMWRKIVPRNRLVLPADVIEPGLVRYVASSRWHVVRRRARLRSIGKAVISLLSSPFIALTSYATQGQWFNIIGPILGFLIVLHSSLINIFASPLLISGRITEKTDGADEGFVSLGFPRKCLILDVDTAHSLTRSGLQRVGVTENPLTVVCTPRLYESLQKDEAVALICIVSISTQYQLAVYRLYEFLANKHEIESSVGSEAPDL